VVSLSGSGGGAPPILRVPRSKSAITIFLNWSKERIRPTATMTTKKNNGGGGSQYVDANIYNTRTWISVKSPKGSL